MGVHNTGKLGKNIVSENTLCSRWVWVMNVKSTVAKEF